MFGQVTILILIQIGGLGFMTMATLILMLMGRRVGLRERLVLQEALNEFSLQGLVALIRKILFLTFSFELVGVMLFSIKFIPEYGFADGLYRSIFHSISAFCNAGFDIMGNYTSFTAYSGDFFINITLMMLIVIGGLGFTVLIDIGAKKNFKNLSLHSKVVLVMTGALLIIGFLFFLIMEYSNEKTLDSGDLNFFEKMLAAMFQSVTARTAGFNTIDQNSMTIPSKFMTTILMFIGASPAGTGGGIKTTTFAVVLLIVYTVLKGRHEITVFDRQVIRGTAYRAVTITAIGLVIVFVFGMVLSVAEQGNPLGTFDNIMFESASAFATVGLSSGITPSLSMTSKIFMIITMFAGRVGPLTLALAFSRSYNRSKTKYKYPEGKIMVG
jgi:trk system potassium uptake protein TrkH